MVKRFEKEKGIVIDREGQGHTYVPTQKTRDRF